LDESVRLWRRTAQRRFLGAALHSLGCALRATAPGDALAAFSEGLEIGRELDAHDLIAACMEGAADGVATGGDPEHAATMLGAAARIRARVGADPHEQADADAAKAACTDAMTADAFARAWGRGAALQTDEAAEWSRSIIARHPVTIS
jgi:hypothetical protein